MYLSGMLEVVVHSTAKNAFSWPGRIMQAKKVQFSIVRVYFVTDKSGGEISGVLHIRENLYSQKFTSISVLTEILYTFILDPSLHHLIALNVWYITSTSPSHFLTAPKDLIQCRETAGFYLLNMSVLAQQNIWMFGSENESSKDLNLVQESPVKAVCQGSWEETQVSQIWVSLSL